MGGKEKIPLAVVIPLDNNFVSGGITCVSSSATCEGSLVLREAGSGPTS